MKSFTIPAKLNGEQLLNELKAVGIALSDVRVVDNLLWLDTNDTKATTVVAAHVGLDSVPTFEQKLESAGISLNELKAALGI